MNKWDMNNLCEPWAAVNEKIASNAGLTESDHQGVPWWNGINQVFIAVRFIRLANRVAVLVYMSISVSANLLSPWPRESTLICIFGFQLILLASGKAFRNFFPWMYDKFLLSLSYTRVNRNQSWVQKLSLYPTSLSGQNSQTDSLKICLNKLYLFHLTFSICFLMDHFPLVFNNIAKGLQSQAYFLESNSICDKHLTNVLLRISPIYEKTNCTLKVALCLRPLTDLIKTTEYGVLSCKLESRDLEETKRHSNYIKKFPEH